MIAKFMARLNQFVSKGWYMPLVTLLSAMDAFIFVVPIEALLIPAVLARPKRWASTAFWVTVGSALGAAFFSQIISLYGPAAVEYFMPGSLQTETWHNVSKFFEERGWWGLSVVSLSPFPQHVCVGVAGLAHMSAGLVFGSVLLGRSIKYFILSWCIVHTPKVLRHLRVFKKGAG